MVQFLGFRACKCLFVRPCTVAMRIRPPGSGQKLQRCGELPQDVSQAVRFLVPLTLPGQAKNKFTACGDRRTADKLDVNHFSRERERTHNKTNICCLIMVSTCKQNITQQINLFMIGI